MSYQNYVPISPNSVAKFKRYDIFEYIILGVSSFFGFIVLIFLGASLIHAPAWAIIPAALFPFLLLILFFRRLDRWEPESKMTTFAAIAWGSLVAVTFSAFFNDGTALVVEAVTHSAELGEIAAAVVSAPIVEEAFKGAFVVAILLFRHTRVHSLMDGLYYGGLSAAGFAFVENILYFVRPFLDESASVSGDPHIDLAVTFFLRAVLSPLVHPIATGMTGLAAAWAVMNVRSVPARLGVAFVGYVSAVVIHAVWNGAPMVFSGGRIVLYILIFFPCGILWMITIMMFSHRERKRIIEGLTPYCQTGQVLPFEVTMVTDMANRRNALSWAAKYGSSAKTLMRDFIHALAVVGLNYKILVKLPNDTQRHAQSAQALARIAQYRPVLQQLEVGSHIQQPQPSLSAQYAAPQPQAQPQVQPQVATQQTRQPAPNPYQTPQQGQ